MPRSWPQRLDLADPNDLEVSYVQLCPTVLRDIWNSNSLCRCWEISRDFSYFSAFPLVSQIRRVLEEGLQKAANETTSDGQVVVHRGSTHATGLCQKDPKGISTHTFIYIYVISNIQKLPISGRKPALLWHKLNYAHGCTAGNLSLV